MVFGGFLQVSRLSETPNIQVHIIREI